FAEKLRNKKKKDEEKKVKEKKTLAPAPIPARNETIYEKICRTIRENVTKATEKAVAISTVQPSFRVFGTPTRLKIMGGGSAIEKKKKEIDDRISIFSYTPIRGNKMNHAARFSTVSGFSPQIQNASTPIDKQAKERFSQQKIPVFDLSDDFLTEKEEKSVKEQEEPLEETELDTAVEPTKVQEKTALLQSTLHNSSLHIYNEQFEETIKIPSETQQETMQNGTFRKAETSMTEILVDSEAEHIEQEEMNYSKKRQRTISPVTIQVMDTELTATEEKENKEQGKRATLQPQQQQILRESRLSVMTTASSRRESLNSLMEDMSIDMQSLDTLENETGATSRVIESRLQTGMTIRQEDDEVLPFYLQNGSFIDMPSYFTQLLHVCGQKEVKAWGSLPKGVFDGRRVKKIGEGSYGEVFS
uniref:Protein kinase domain-containing protein n=2 Tax=Caenorhabditis japonica TaxID=281687 RepID=A0A8R1IYN0_CAEJA